MNGQWRYRARARASVRRDAEKAVRHRGDVRGCRQDGHRRETGRWGGREHGVTRRGVRQWVEGVGLQREMPSFPSQSSMGCESQKIWSSTSSGHVRSCVQHARVRAAGRRPSRRLALARRDPTGGTTTPSTSGAPRCARTAGRGRRDPRASPAPGRVILEPRRPGSGSGRPRRCPRGSSRGPARRRARRPCRARTGHRAAAARPGARSPGWRTSTGTADR